MTQITKISAPQTRQDAETITQGFDTLLADARKLAANISFGAHNRRRAGYGEDFWQYRPAAETDTARQIDWRRSAQSDGHFVRQYEWQNTQSVHIWVDRSASMLFQSQNDLPLKAYRAAVIALAISLLLLKAGEKVGLMDLPDPPKQGQIQIEKIAAILAQTNAELEFDAPTRKEMKPGQKAVFVSDFLGDWDTIFESLSYSANQNVDGYLVQILDPLEELFSFKGRTVFLSMNENHRFETLRAQALRDEYQIKLAERKSALQRIAQRTGWQYCCHTTDEVPTVPLMWLYTALGDQH